MWPWRPQVCRPHLYRHRADCEYRHTWLNQSKLYQSCIEWSTNENAPGILELYFVWKITVKLLLSLVFDEETNRSNETTHQENLAKLRICGNICPKLHTILQRMSWLTQWKQDAGFPVAANARNLMTPGCITGYSGIVTWISPLFCDHWNFSS